MAIGSDNKFPKVIITEGTAPSSPSAGDQKLFIDSSDHHLKRKNSGGTVTDIEGGASPLTTKGDVWGFSTVDARIPVGTNGDVLTADSTQTLGLHWATPSAAALNPADFPEMSPPSTPASGHVSVYAKADGRIYSKDDAGTEYGPFDAAGGGGTLYVVDETFPGSSLPAGWTFTGSGSATVSGGKVALSFTAQSDRLMFAHTFGTGTHIVRANTKNYTGTHGGMVGLAVFDASGHGYAISPYNDGATYMWDATGTAYQYSATDNATLGTTPSLTDVWWEFLISGGRMVGAGYSTDGATWTVRDVANPLGYTFTQVGICRLFTANETMDLYELTCTEP